MVEKRRGFCFVEVDHRPPGDPTPLLAYKPLVPRQPPLLFTSVTTRYTAALERFHS